MRVLLARQRRVSGLVHQQQMPRHDLVEGLVQRQHLAEMRGFLRRLASADIARLLADLDEQERLIVWRQVAEEDSEAVLEEVPDDLREALVLARPLPSVKNMLNAFVVREGRLSQASVEAREDLIGLAPIWVDLAAPSAPVRSWVGAHFGVDLPNPAELTDLEASARFFIDERGGIHLHSDFLLDSGPAVRSVAVAFVLHQGILFSLRQEELPVFRLLRLRARTQANPFADGLAVLLDLYAADVEYSADSLEELYGVFETLGKRVLNPSISDEAAARTLAEIARGEDLNGRIRRNVQDTRRALSFLIRGRRLDDKRLEDARQILRDIESLDLHTSFLSGKINFLMDSTVGFININQNKRVSRLTTMGVVFTPITVLASIGGMSEYSMMTAGISWPVAYAGFLGGMVLVGLASFLLLRFSQRRGESGSTVVQRDRRWSGR